MSTLTEAWLADGAVRRGDLRDGPQEKVRRRPRTAPVGRMVQPERQGRPLGARGPEVTGARPSGGVPPAETELTIQLTDRGVALVMGFIVALVLAALVCIGVTAVRVTSEPVAEVGAVAVNAPAPWRAG
ncbi:MAG TPA: hypothetical protein GXZ30_12720 [Propionibacterium sp.]|nr:hypothetical protein [Propionibacterium sp.]